jgi:hypothetical protein
MVLLLVLFAVTFILHYFAGGKPWFAKVATFGGFAFALYGGIRIVLWVVSLITGHKDALLP